MYPRQYLYLCDNCGKYIHAVAVSKGQPPHSVPCVDKGCQAFPSFRFDGPVVQPEVSEAQWELYDDGNLTEVQKKLGDELPFLKLRKRTDATPDYLSPEVYELYRKE